MNKGKICVSICAETAHELIGKIKRADEVADLIEVRFDCLHSDEVESARSLLLRNGEISRPIVATFRPREQGGRRRLSLDQRAAFWSYAQGGNWLADLEDDVYGKVVGWEKRLASYHDVGRGADIIQIYQRLSRCEADIIKIAVSARDIVDAIPVWNLLEGRGDLVLIPIAMGEAGKWTRILGLAHGSYMTYAALDPGAETAAGQFTAKELIEVFRVKELDLDTRVYGVIGEPVSNSLSPYLHNAAFAAAGINAVFLPLQVTDLDEFFRRMVRKDTREVELNFAGFAVTMPHKRSIMKHLDHIDPEAEKIGAVNTVRIEGDKLTGYNTDPYGFVEALRSQFSDLSGLQIAVLGAGGAARACVYALKQEHADVTTLARDESKAMDLASEFGGGCSDLSNLSDRYPAAPNNFDIIVNATPFGMSGPLEAQTPLTAEQLQGVKFVFDLVTSPGDTPLMKEAKKAGVTAMGGEEMLLRQGAKQFEIWTGKSAPLDIMRQALVNKQKEIHV